MRSWREYISGNINKVLKQKNIFVKNLGGSGHNPIHYDMTLKSFFPTKLPENLNPEFVIFWLWKMILIWIFLGM